MPAAQPIPRLTRFRRWLAAERGLDFPDYDALWRWSVSDLRGFWRAVWDFHAIESPTPWETELVAPVMPGARWFPGAQVNFARQALRHAEAASMAGVPAIVFGSERIAEPVAVSWPELARRVGAFAAALRAMGVQRGDRVAAFLPNTPDALVAMLGCASVGAIWSVCSPDMGPVAVLDRFRQIEPVVLVAADGQFHGGVLHDRRGVVAEVAAGLPSLRHLVAVAEREPAAPAAPGFVAAGLPARVALHELAALLAPGAPVAEPEWLPFEHPLWIVYSSGTTGLPKPIVHGHGGVMLEFLKGALHNDVAPSAETGDCFFWYSSTGWIMWNAQLAALLGGTTVCVYDGSPAAPAQPGGPADWGALWRFAERAGVTLFGAGAAFYASGLKAGIEPQRIADLSRLRAIGSTGSPLSDDAYDWIWQQLPRVDGEPIWINAISGGTDFAGAFVAGNRELPQVKGEMQCRCLGADVQSWSEDGRPLVDEVGELVCTTPLPSMPLFFWGDADGRRLRESYFEMFEGVWRHGDWIRITPRGGAVIYGRSDATINRHGIRMGTAELYRAVEALPEVLDSLVVDLEVLGRPSWMPLFVVLRDGVGLDDALVARMKAAVRAALSPRHVPDEVVAMAAIPRTLSGKKMELPVKKLLLGADPAKVMNRDAMANADCVEAYVAYARARQALEAAAGG